MIDFSKISALSAFNPKDENTIARLGDEGIVGGATHHAANIFRWMRRASTKSANNAMRTDLLRSLGEALGIGGMTTGKDGKVRFPKAFMDQLEKVLGKANLKRGDFDIDRNGEVTSGKPLTGRRIRMLVERVRALANEERDGGVQSIASAPTAPAAASDPKSSGAEINKEVVAAFEEKKAEILEDITEGFVREAAADSIKGFLEHVEREIKAFGMLPELFKGVHTDLEATTAFQKATGMIFHPEYIPLKEKTEEIYLNYAKNVVAEYVNLLMERFVHDQSQERENSRSIPSQFPCMEGKTGVLQDEKARRDFGVVADHDKTTPLSECIFKEIDAYRKNTKEGRTWAECKTMLKKRLVGIERPIDSWKNGAHVAPGENVRKVKASDIDKLKPFITDTLMMDD